jgi:hypothetical protein
MPEIKENLKVILINSDNPDYYQWGRNCGILNYTISEIINIIDTFHVDNRIKEDEFEEFLYGYFSIPIKKEKLNV